MGLRAGATRFRSPHFPNPSAISPANPRLWASIAQRPSQLPTAGMSVAWRQTSSPCRPLPIRRRRDQLTATKTGLEKCQEGRNEFGVPVRRRWPPPGSTTASHLRRPHHSSCETSDVAGFTTASLGETAGGAWRMGTNGVRIRNSDRQRQRSPPPQSLSLLLSFPEPRTGGSEAARHEQLPRQTGRTRLAWRSDAGPNGADYRTLVLHLYMGSNLAALRAQIPRFHVEPSAATAGRSSARATRASAAVPSAGAAR